MPTEIAYKLVQLPHYSSLLARPPYTKYYTPGTTVVANPGTVGLMVWTDQYWAKQFIENAITFLPMCLLKVIPYDIHIVDYICESASPDWLSEYYRLPFAQRLCISQPIPPGTMCCGSVEVLREPTL